MQPFFPLGKGVASTMQPPLPLYKGFAGHNEGVVNTQASLLSPLGCILDAQGSQEGLEGRPS
jgi:hypothetical protein